MIFMKRTQADKIRTTAFKLYPPRLGKPLD
jgi:hypothetical protein